mgnify:CR=1 FL=1
MKILYIEDDELTLKNMIIILKKFSSEIYPCVDYHEAIKTYENNDIDLIITDIEMPSKSGIDIIKYVREKNDSTPIIVQTAYRSHDYLYECANLNIQAYLYKPITLKDLKEVFEKINNYVQIDDSIQIDDDIDYKYSSKQLISKKNGIIELTKKELQLFELLLKNRNNVVNFEEIELEIWDVNLEVMTNNSLRTIIKTLRKKIGKEKIANLSGIGYKLII